METSSYNQNIPVIPPHPAAPRRKRVARWLTLAALLLVIGTSSYMALRDDESDTVAAASVATVEITSSFEPQTIKVKKGESVTWVNKDTSPHYVMADPYPSGNELAALNSSEPLAGGESYTATFDEAGTFSYHDQLNPAALNAVVIVE